MASDSPIMASVDLWPLDWAPMYWSICDGKTLQITQYSALYSLLGTTYGGDGRTTFGLPDLRGRVPIGAGQQPGAANYVLGRFGGRETVTLTSNEMPSHSHAASGSVAPSAAIAGRGVTTSTDPTNNYPATSPENTPVYGTPASATAKMASNTVTVTVQASGSGQAFNVLPPYLVLRYIIALAGVYPSRE